MQPGAGEREHSKQPPPSGTVTFWFSDIEGSTTRWEADRSAMAEALRRHDQILRSAIVSHGGYVFKTIGDAFCAAFESAIEAVSAALDAQLIIGHSEWPAVDGLRVRMAIHTGSAEEREGDYFGPTVNRVARLLAIGHGGQVLLSLASAELTRDLLGPNVALLELGEHRLKDISQPVRVFQLVAPGLTSNFPRLRSLDVSRTNVPHQLTSFIGREHDLAEINTLLKSTRLLTLIGTGGIGKTRCAIQVCSELIDEYEHGVWFVELASVKDPQFVMAALASVLEIRESASRTLLETLTGFLKSRRLLLVLDNCEHVVAEVARIVDAILRATPRVVALATSRQRLGSDGEVLYRLPSLGVPVPTARLTAEQALRSSAVALFVARAAAVDTTFRLTDDNAAAVAEICRAVDGIALALELAAARIPVIDVGQIAHLLRARFRLLTGGSRTSLPRQQTMRATLDWSYDLLSEREKLFFDRLSPFINGFTLEASDAVCIWSPIEDTDALDLLTALLDKSLVAVGPSGSSAIGTRYRLLESLREYALERLAERNEKDSLLRRFASWCLTLAEATNVTWATLPSDVWVAKFEPELENLRSSLSWALEQQADVALGQQLVAASRRFWARVFPEEGLQWVNAALQYVVAQTPLTTRAALLLALAQMHVALQRYRQAVPLAEEAREAYAQIGDELGLAESRGFCGFALSMVGRASEGESFLEQALDSYRALGAKQFVAYALQDLAIARYFAGNLSSARDLLRQALTLFRALGNERGAASVAGNLAEIEFRAGNIEAALRCGTQALGGRANGRDASIYLANVAAYLVAAGRWEEARERARESLSRAGTFPVATTLDGIMLVPLVCSDSSMLASEQRTRRASIRTSRNTTGW